MTRAGYRLQRLTAMVLAPLVLIHFVVMIVAVQGGLSGEEILSRTRGSVIWGTVYASFVVAAAIHAAIGIGQILRETTGLTASAITVAQWGLGLGLTALGFRAVWAVVV